MAVLGWLEEVSIRDGWAGEATDFTPWLCQEENLRELSNTVDIPLSFIKSEANIGGYRLDILAKRNGTEEMVIIKNQFDSTDHSCLGQLMTYAAGVGSDGGRAKTIIWIAEVFNEPHRSALDWLNKCTEPGIRFFGIELELWKIGDSLPAPRFNVVSRPNDWQKVLHSRPRGHQKKSLLFELLVCLQELLRRFQRPIHPDGTTANVLHCCTKFSPRNTDVLPCATSR